MPESTTSPARLPLSDLTVVEIGGGASGAYCCRLLADAGATVIRAAHDESRRDAGIVRADSELEAAYAAYLSAGKRKDPAKHAELAKLCERADLVVLGEESGLRTSPGRPRLGCVALSWFGHAAEYRDWKGSDLVIQALTGMPHLSGPVEGPPLASGDRQATCVAGVTAYIAACALLLSRLAGRRDAGATLELSILDANLPLAEMHLHMQERDGVAAKRYGLNRFAPNAPVGIYPCRSGWVGITVTTPDQWRALCGVLDVEALSSDPDLVTRELRFQRIDEVEALLCGALAKRDAADWAAIGREHRIPMVVVPDAAGMLAHPIFLARGSMASLQLPTGPVQVPLTPFGLQESVLARTLGDASAHRVPTDKALDAVPSDGHGRAKSLLGHLKIVDFAMGWAGPLASRMLADLGAQVIKVEAARYPDWWRAANWSPEFVANRDFERAKIFTAMNRGKRGLSVDLTATAGRDLALALIDRADAVIENQAAGVMRKFGLDWDALKHRPSNIVMVSMSAFGTGNAWSSTRAYGSTLEQASGFPSLIGSPDTAPTMGHLAHGDPVGGLYGCAALLTALVHRQRAGKGQHANVSMVEAMLQFATPGLLEHQIRGQATRRGNRHHAMVPQGIFKAQGNDQWVAISVADANVFLRLAETIGKPEWSQAPTLRTLDGRRKCQDDIEQAIAAWCSTLPPMTIARLLQRAGVAAAPVLHVEDLWSDPHLERSGFFHAVDREVSGRQRQMATPFKENGERLFARSPAPLLGEHTWDVLRAELGLARDEYERLIDTEVIGLVPKPAKNITAGR